MLLKFFKTYPWMIVLLPGLLVLGAFYQYNEVTPGNTPRNPISVENFQVVQTHPDRYAGKWVSFTGSLRTEGPGYVGRFETAMGFYDDSGQQVMGQYVYREGILPAGTVLPAKIIVHISQRQIVESTYELLPPPQ